MARYSFGAEITHLIVSEDAGNADALIVAPPSTPIPLSVTRGGPPATDFLLWNTSTSAYDIVATSIVSTASGHLPDFEGPDGVSQLYAADGTILTSRNPGGGEALTSYAEQVASLGDYPESFPPQDHNHDYAPVSHTHSYATTGEVADAIASAASSYAAANHNHDSRYYTEQEIDSMFDAVAGAVVIGGILDEGASPPPGTPVGTIFFVRGASGGGGGGGGTTPDTIEYVGGDFDTSDGTTSQVTASAVIPAATQVGDLILAYWMTAGPTGTATWTNPTGFTALFTPADIGSNGHHRGFYRFAQAGDAGSTVSGTLGPSGSRQVMVVAVYRNVASIDGVVATVSATSATSHSTSSITTAADQCVSVAMAADRSSLGDTTWTPPAGYTERGEASRTGTGGKTATIADHLTPVAAGATVGPVAFTSNNATAQSGKVLITLAPTLS